jgi:enterochelin esterase-like enzyme
MIKMPRSFAALVATLGLSAVGHSLRGTDDPSVRPAVSQAPLHFPRGGPATPADLAEMAKLASLPALTPGAGEGDYLIRPPYAPAPEQAPGPEVPKGRVVSFMLPAAGSVFYPGTGMRGAVPARRVTVYIPRQYVPGTAAPLLVTQDAMGARDAQLPTVLDHLISAHRVPAIVAVMVGNGGGDARGSERGLEYDTVSGRFAEFIEAEVLPRVAREYQVTFTRDPDGRATMGGSSGGAAAFTMAWFHPELYRRVLTYSGTYTNNQTEVDPALPHGAWEYHEHLVPKTEPKPLRIWMEVGEHDNGSVNTAADLHNWVIANERMAAALKAKGYHYQFVYALGAGHVDRRVVAQTLPEALEWLWQGYLPSP